MFWRHRARGWPIDPSKVAFGSVVEHGVRNLSRSHVRVRYHGDTAVQFVPLGPFMRRCRASIRDGQALHIEHLLVAPVIKQRYAVFFDRLTDWGPATLRARNTPRTSRVQPGRLDQK